MDIKNIDGDNGGNGGARVCRTFGDSVRYPVKFDLKAIIDANIDPQDSMKALGKILDQFEVPYENWRQKSSSGGKYISYTVSVDIASQEILDNLYRELKKVPGLKFAL